MDKGASTNKEELDADGNREKPGISQIKLTHFISENGVFTL